MEYLLYALELVYMVSRNRNPLLQLLRFSTSFDGVFHNLASHEFTDVAFDIQNKEPSLATKRGSYQETALHVLAQKPLLFSVNENQLGIYSRIISRSGQFSFLFSGIFTSGF